MKIRFCGAARTVTGSCHLLTLDNGYKILLDCGLYQGREAAFEDFNEKFEYFNPEEIDCLILSHAHIDHCGRIPKLVKDGFKGDIICTSATRDLAAIMLLDSAYIQEKDIKFIKKRRKDKKDLKPLYTVVDAKLAMENFVGIAYHRWYKINENVSVYFTDAGHILGSASVTLKIKQKDGYEKFVGFTGDIGRPERPILRDPEQMPPVDYMICESTYGNKEHHDRIADENDLLAIVNRACVEKKGKLIIPAFSVGRTQEIVYMLDKLETAGKLPRIPVFVDSPLAINATEIFRSHPECFDAEILDYMNQDPNPFGFYNLHYTREVEASKRINLFKGAAIIISASGMMQAGRIKHHLLNNIENDKTTILIVGYCAPGTLGGRLRAGEQKVRIFGEEKSVKANVEMLDSFSAHGDQSEMIDFLDNQNRKKLKKIFLVHGEIKRQITFKDALLKADFRKVEIPSMGQIYKL